jgi:poly [ADP-ribose] polymerase
MIYLFNNLANYCFTKREEPEGLMLLCEVALGKMCECFNATSYSADTLPTGTQSAKGCGQTSPDPKGERRKTFFLF